MKITKNGLKIWLGIVYVGAILLCLVGMWWNRMTFVDTIGDLILFVSYGLISLDYIFLLKGNRFVPPWYEMSRKLPTFRQNIKLNFRGIFRKKEPEWIPPTEWADDVEVVEEEIIPLAVEPVPYFGDQTKTMKFGIPVRLSVKRAVAFILLLFSFLTTVTSLMSPSTMVTVVFTIPAVVILFDYMGKTQYGAVVSSLHILDDLERI